MDVKWILWKTANIHCCLHHSKSLQEWERASRQKLWHAPAVVSMKARLDIVCELARGRQTLSELSAIVYYCLKKLKGMLWFVPQRWACAVVVSIVVQQNGVCQSTMWIDCDVLVACQDFYCANSESFSGAHAPPPASQFFQSTTPLISKSKMPSYFKLKRKFYLELLMPTIAEEDHSGMDYSIIIKPPDIHSTGSSIRIRQDLSNSFIFHWLHLGRIKVLSCQSEACANTRLLHIGHEEYSHRPGVSS